MALGLLFDEPGEMPWVCNEYCGVGHHNMYGKMIVTEVPGTTRDALEAVEGPEQGRLL